MNAQELWQTLPEAFREVIPRPDLPERQLIYVLEDPDQRQLAALLAVIGLRESNGGIWSSTTPWRVGRTSRVAWRTYPRRWILVDLPVLALVLEQDP